MLMMVSLAYWHLVGHMWTYSNKTSAKIFNSYGPNSHDNQGAYVGFVGIKHYMLSSMHYRSFDIESATES